MTWALRANNYAEDEKRIVVELPGLKVLRIKKLLGKTAQLTLD